MFGGGGGGTPQAPSEQYVPQHGFHFHDIWSACDIELDNRSLMAKATGAVTAYSREVFSGQDEVSASMTIIDLRNSSVGFGIVGEGSIAGCRKNAVGHSAIADSIGCAVGRGEVLIVYKGRVLFRAHANTNGQTEVSLTMEGGRLKFAVDGRDLQCGELAALNLSKGRFRVGSSLMRARQHVILATIAEVQSLTEDEAAPDIPYHPANGFVFHDRWRSIDVLNKTQMVCRHSVKATVYTEQIFRGSMDMRVTLAVVRPLQGVVGFGLLGFGSTLPCGDYVLGEKEVPDSIGVIIRGRDLAIMFRDELVFRAQVKMPQQPELSMSLEDGHLRFELNGQNLNCDLLDELNFSGGVFRIGASLTQQGQAAEMVFDAKSIGGYDEDAAEEKYEPSKGFTFQDRWRSIGVNEGSQLFCKTKGAVTAYSRDVFRGTQSINQTLVVENLANDRLCFGVLGVDSTKPTENHLLGSKDIKSSVAFSITKNSYAIVFASKLIMSAELKTPVTRPEVTLILTNGQLSFELDGTPIPCKALSELNFGAAGVALRLGVSFGEAGQRAHLKIGPGGPGGLPSDVLTSDKTMYSWACNERRFGLGDDGTALTAKGRGLLAFTKEVFSTAAPTPDLVCDSCFRGAPNRRPCDGHTYRCNQCPKFFFCNDCFNNKTVKHQHGRGEFTRSLGGSFHELRFSVEELLGANVDVGLVRLGKEEDFANEASPHFVTFGASGWQQGKTTVSTAPVVGNSDVWVRAFNRTLYVYCKSKVMYKSPLPEGEFRFAVRFNREGQRLKMKECLSPVPLGTPAIVTGDAEFLAQEAAQCSLNASNLPNSVPGWLISEDLDGTVQLNLEGPAAKKAATVWVPRTCVSGLNNRSTPALSVAKLKEGDKVVRNHAQWIWGVQDGGSDGNIVGEIVTADSDDWVTVRWSSGTEQIYRYRKGVYHVMPWIGNVGDRVVRNPAAFTGGDIDKYGPGTVKSVSTGGVVTVAWDSGATGNYKFNEVAQEIQRHGTNAIPPLVAEGAEPPVPPPPGQISMAPVGGAGAGAGADRPNDDDNLVDVAMKPAIRLKPNYKPPAPLAKCMLDAKTAMPTITEMDFIVEQCSAIAKDRRKTNKNFLDFDEALALALFTFDIGPMTTCEGADNFYYVVNNTFRGRDQQALFALQPFMYHFKMAWNKLPNQPGTYWRGLPDEAASKIINEYSLGREIFWSAITSLTTEYSIATSFKKGTPGLMLEIAVVDTRSIMAWSAIQQEAEVILEPQTKLIVTQNAMRKDDGMHMKLQQVKQENAFVF